MPDASGSGAGLAGALKEAGLRSVTHSQLKAVLTESGMEHDSIEVLLGHLNAETGKVAVKEFLEVMCADGHPKPCDDTFCISNTLAIKSPAVSQQTIMDNTLLFLPRLAVIHLGITPNMDDKGDQSRTMWMGRVWELRALLAEGYKLRHQRHPVETSKQQWLDSKLEEIKNNPELTKLMQKMGAGWKAAAYRARCGFSSLEPLRFAMLRGTVLFAHGSGGCNWDNTRVCRMLCGMGFMVIAPDGFAYPPTSAMGKMRHKQVQPLRTELDDVDYWANDLIYASSASGDHTYSTNADHVLQKPDEWRALYERCYQLRRSELHFVAERLPHFVKTQGFYIAGESEGAMSVTRFDDNRYGKAVLGRIIISFSIEYCYFTPRPEDARIGGQREVPTLNIIGTADEYFGPNDSIAKIVAENKVSGYGDTKYDGHGYDMLVEQNISSALVCVMEGAGHSPCPTNDNFLRLVFNAFVTAPDQIHLLPDKWVHDPVIANMVQVQQSFHSANAKVTQVFVPKLNHPQHLTLLQFSRLNSSKKGLHRILQVAKEEAVQQEKRKAEVQKMLEQAQTLYGTSASQ